jgi:hypothetical protein
VASKRLEEVEMISDGFERGVDLLRMYQSTGDIDVLDRAVVTFRDLLDVSTEYDLDRAAILNNLGFALRVRYQRTGEPAALVEALDVGREAVAEAPAGDPNRVLFLNNLSISLQLHYRLTGALSELGLNRS